MVGDDVTITIDIEMFRRPPATGGGSN